MSQGDDVLSGEQRHRETREREREREREGGREGGRERETRDHRETRECNMARERGRKHKNNKRTAVNNGVPNAYKRIGFTRQCRKREGNISNP